MRGGYRIVLATLLMLGGCGALTVLLSPFPVDRSPRSGLPIDAPISIRRDRFGIPHIQAETDGDLSFALGYVHGQDRLAQLELLRRASRGELASVLGRDFVESDIAVATFELEKIAEPMIADLGDEILELLQRYVDGVNASVSPDSLPVELAVLGIEPEPFTIEDGVIGALWIATDQFDSGRELWMAEYVAGLGRETAADLFGITLAEDLSHLTAITRLADGPPDIDSVARSGSNAWAISGIRTASGAPILASDPHGPLALPSRWYPVVVDSPTIHFRGVSAPGLPFFVGGTNGRVSFAFTTTTYDSLDYFVEDLNDARTHYRVDGEWIELRREPISIKVFGTDQRFEEEIRYTHRGPVIFSRRRERHLSIRRTFGNVSSDALANFDLVRAGTVAEAMQAAQQAKLIQSNYVFADADGNIGWQVTGQVPLRNGLSGAVPADGTRAGQDWLGFLPAEELPRETNPGRAYVSSANNRPHLDEFFVPDGVYAAHRIDRINEILGSTWNATPADMMAMQQDVKSRQFAAYREALFEAAGADPVADAVISELLAWDGRLAADSRPAVLFDQLRRELPEIVLQNRLAPAFEELAAKFYDIFDTSETRWLSIVSDPDSQFWQTTRFARGDPTPLTRRQVMTEALRRVAQNAPSGRWGDLNRVEIRNEISSLAPQLSPLLDVPDEPAEGGFHTIKVSRQAFGSDVRLIVDMKEPNSVNISLPGGQSERLLSPHYRDQYELWRASEYWTLPSAPERGDQYITLTP